jgi:hypothetical protein
LTLDINTREWGGQPAPWEGMLGAISGLVQVQNAPSINPTNDPRIEFPPWNDAVNGVQNPEHISSIRGMDEAPVDKVEILINLSTYAALGKSLLHVLK